MTSDNYLDALLSLPGLQGAQVSPDGRWVAWTWFRAGPAADVYVAPTDGTAGPTRLSDAADDTVLVSWAPDSAAVVVERDRDGNERSRLFRVDLARPLEAVPLTEPDPAYFIRGGQLHPNGRWLVYGANVDVAAGVEIEPTWIYRHDLASGERVALARPPRAGTGRPQLNTAGTHILYTRADLHPAGRQVWLVGIDGADERELFNFGAETKCSASWFPDGRRVVVLAEAKTHRRLGVWDATMSELRWLLDDPARSIEQAYVPFGSDRIVVIEVRGGRIHASLLDPVTGAEDVVPAAPGNLIPLAPVANGEWVGQFSSSTQPADAVRFRPDDVRPEHFVSLTRVWDRISLRAEDFTRAEDVHWRSVDGLEIQGWLYRVARNPARGTVVYIHGGPTSHSQDAINNEIQFLVKEGFTVLDPNYRGSTGFGLEFREAIRATGWGGLEQEDIRAGIAALIAAGIATPGKVGVTGTSYGGYSSWHAITHFSTDIVAAAAPICGMTDLVIDYETTRPDLRPYSEEMIGGSPATAPERYRERSPIHFVGHIRGRMLIVQGLQDPNVTPENVRAVEVALRDAGIPYELLAFADEGHGIARPKNQRILYTRLSEFFGAM
ncbi:MAG TPA: prolyl oligopeptidase family serine peptidase [Ktedonobacterales bacterium]|jgi:dipeptidyl aminopeptidase/acylaminoacyl peptidase